MRALILCIATGVASVAVSARADTLIGQSRSGDKIYFVILDNPFETVKMVRTRIEYAQPRKVGDVDGVLVSSSIEALYCTERTRITRRLEVFTSPAPDAKPAWRSDFAANSPSKPVDTDLSTASAIVFRMACQNAAPVVASSTPVVPLQPAIASSSDPHSSPDPRIVSGSTASSSAPSSSVLSYPSTTASSQVPVAASPVGSSESGASLADYRPFADSEFTLGQMGHLAEYVYYDRNVLNVQKAELTRIQNGRDALAKAGRPSSLATEAARRLALDVETYSDEINSKEQFLAGSQLVPVAFAVTHPVRGFKAELYQSQRSGEYVLVFRGTQDEWDWVSNIWAGFDLFAIEAPHYQAALYLVGDLITKRRIRPLVVGHSLGGGMAQYVGAKFNLKVVGFNAAPLPERYLREATADPAYVRLFSAVEIMSRPNGQAPEALPDPVSIRMPEYTAPINRLFPNFQPVRGHALLAKPVCVQSTPTPAFTLDEQRHNTARLEGAMHEHFVTALAGDGTLAKSLDKTVVQGIRMNVRVVLADPAWQAAADPSTDDTDVMNDIRDKLTEVATERYETAGGLVNLAKNTVQATNSDTMRGMGKGFLGLGETVGNMYWQAFLVTHIYQPHSMERFNRGMHSATDVNVFLVDPVRAQCTTFAPVN